MANTHSNSIYIHFILNNILKIMTQVDRDQNSQNFGSCDRNFWHLKIRDFSSAILQQTGLTLALLHELDFPGNTYFNNENVKKWTLGTLYFWKKIQLKDGSFNEYYPNEHGFPPTAFSFFSTAYVYRLFGLEDQSLLDALEKTAKYLVKNTEKNALNQEMASICGLYVYYDITKDDLVQKGLQKKLDTFLSRQSEDGWFPEYGGADFGYVSVTLDMLAEYYWMSKDEKIIDPLNRIIDFIKYFCHPDGTIGGEYGSRNTIYFLPSGLEVMIDLGNKDALNIKASLYRDIEKSSYFQNSIDDRYFSHYVMHSFLRAVAKENTGKKGDHLELPCFKNHQKYFKDCGLISFRNENYYAVVGAKKGGMLKIFDDKQEKFNDYGYRILKNDNKISATNWLDDNTGIKVSGNDIEIEKFFNEIKTYTSSPRKHLLLRIISSFSAILLKKILKKRLILIDKEDSVKFKRKISFGGQSVKIEDHITDNKGRHKIISANSLSLRHVASDKFFSFSDLIARDKFLFENTEKIKISQEFNVKEGKLKLGHE